METKPDTKFNFIEEIVSDDLKTGKHKQIITRFPPEPNGYLHIGHAKSICLNFGLAQKFGGITNLRFDDTNPITEDTEYVDSIMEDVRWLGFQWNGQVRYASDYFEQLYDWALELIKKGLAYVDDQDQHTIASQKGTPTRPGLESPFRNRSIEENLELFIQMKNGAFKDGERVLRAKIDMASPNMHLRDPIMYRILHAHHHRTANTWCIYPMYDWAHGQSDYVEGITHSICTLEFEVHRPLYDWFATHIKTGNYKPRQIEFARLNLSYTVMSKRKLLELVKERHVSGWDDPRMPTISGLRRRGYTPESIRNFAERIGVAKRDNVIDVGLLEFMVREHLNMVATRVMAVLDPVKLVITNYPEDEVEMLEVINNPENEQSATHMMPFSRELFIERSDFMEDPPKKYFRLAPGGEVRLKGAYIIKGEKVIKNSLGEIIEIHATYDPDTRSGMEGAKRKVKGTLHWVSAAHAKEIEVRLYDRLFLDEEPAGHKDRDFKEFLNPDSFKKRSAKVEPFLYDHKSESHYQFTRLGYFYRDPDSTTDRLVFNRTVGLRDNWAQKGK